MQKLKFRARTLQEPVWNQCKGTLLWNQPKPEKKKAGGEKKCEKKKAHKQTPPNSPGAPSHPWVRRTKQRYRLGGPRMVARRESSEV